MFALIFCGSLHAVTQEEFNDKFRPLLQENPQILNSSQGKDIVVLLGATRSGKSTTLNFLNNIPMGLDEDNEFINLENIQPNQYCRISNTGNSETLAPKYFNVNGHIIYDLAGWNNNTGAVDSLIGAAFIKHIIEKAKSVKIAFVISEDSVIAEGGERIMSFFTKAKAVFSPVISELEKHSIVILTKASERENRWNYLQRKMCSGCFTDNKLFGSWDESRVFPFSKGQLKEDERQGIINAIGVLEPKAFDPQSENRLNIDRFIIEMLRMK